MNTPQPTSENTPYNALRTAAQALLAALSDPEQVQSMMGALQEGKNIPAISDLQEALARGEDDEVGLPLFAIINGSSWGAADGEYYLLPGEEPVAYENLAHAIDVTNRTAIEEDNPSIRLYQLVPVDDKRVVNPYQFVICQECDQITPVEEAVRVGDDWYCKKDAPQASM